MDYKQCDIVLVNLSPKKGDEVRKTRPALILSDELDNNELDTLIVMPLSSHLIDDTYPYRFRLPQRDGLQQDSDILINHIRTISQQRVITIISTITPAEYASVKQALCKVI